MLIEKTTETLKVVIDALERGEIFREDLEPAATRFLNFLSEKEKEDAQQAEEEATTPEASSTCIYDPCWQNRCGKPTVNGTSFCESHHGKKCVVCGEQATRECNFTGQFCCGAPLCDNCEDYEMEVNFMGTKDHGAWGTLRHGHRKKIKPAEEVQS